MKNDLPKILFLVQLPPPVHGVSVINKYVVNNPLWKNEFETKTLSLDFNQVLEDMGKITPGKLIKMLFFSFRLIYVMITYRPQLVYFTIMPTGKIFYRDAFFTGVIKLFRGKIIFHLHGKGVNEAVRRSRFKKWLYKKTFKNTSVISLTKTLAADISDIFSEQPYLLPNCMEATDPVFQQQGKKVPVILFLSNLVKAKGIEIFLESLAQLRRQGFHFHARIVGNEYDYSYKETLEYCRKNDLMNVVELCGPLYGNDKKLELANSSILVLPSGNECLPLVILEGMQAGLAVVATRIGGIPDVIRSMENGLLINTDDPFDLANKIKLLLTDETLRIRLGEQAKQDFHKEYTLEKFNDRLHTIFEQVLTNRK